jgi:hypothetical protein
MWLRNGTMTEDVQQPMREAHTHAPAQPVQIGDVPLPASTTWWQVTRSGRGVVTEVLINKPSGSAMGVWSLRHPVSDAGQAGYEIDLLRRTDSVSGVVVARWTLPARIDDDDLEYELGDLVGVRIARGMIKRLRNGPIPGDAVSVRG